MSEVVAQYQTAVEVRRSAAVLRAGTLVWHDDRSVLVVNANGTRTITSEWELYTHEVTPDSDFVLALGDDAKRAVVWETHTGRRLFDFVGDVGRRQSLRAGLGTFGGELYGFFSTWNESVSVISLRDGAERAWLATTGMFWYHVSRICQLNDGWLAIHGYHDGEGRDTVVAVPVLDALQDPMTLYSALFERPSVREWGYRTAVGPAGAGHAVFFRDPEWEDDDPPDDPTEAFRGLVIWDLDGREVTQRIDYDGDVEREAIIGADGERVALTLRDGAIDVVARADGSVERVEGIALDPYRMEVARVEGGTITIVKL